MTAPILDNPTIRMFSKDFTSATPGTTGDDPAWGGGTVCAVSTTPFLEYKVKLPKTGKWHFHVNLAAQSSRPATLTINGVKQTQAVCGDVTGSWGLDTRRWFVYGPFDFKEGDNVFRLEFSNCMPHLKEFGFTADEVAPAPTPPVTEGAPQPTEKRNISGIVNEFASVTAISGNSLTLSGNANPFKPGDRAIVIQMAGATIDTANTDKFGAIVNLGGAGQYVWVNVVSVSDQNVKLGGADLSGFDVKGKVQLVRACSHAGDLAVTGTITAPQWNGTTGGVVVIESAGTIELAEDIDASARGFVGGPKSPAGGSSGELGYAYAAAACAGNKGTGIVAIGPEHVGGRGPAANGGGGGNAHNAGGGGGGNGGVGGRGASEYEGVGGGPKVNGGLGGCALDHADRAFMGGGGGAGQDNNNQSSGGGNGGGIIILKAKTISGPSGRFVRANGGAAGAAGGDGAGGGGAGGTVILDAPTISGSFTVQANGGRGGDCGAEHGYGAGGGGGTIRSQNPLPTSITVTVLPGDPGSCGRPRGATNAEKGILGLLPKQPTTGISAEEWEKARAALENRIAALEAELAKCSGCSAKIETLTSDLAALTQKLAERDQKCGSYEQTIAALEKQIADLSNAQERKNADYEARIGALEAKIAKCGDCETKIIEQQKVIADLTDRLSKLEHAVASTPPAKPEHVQPTTLPPVWPPSTTPARMGISYIHFVGAEKTTQGDEYIEIKNTGGTAQDVAGWRVRAGSASQEFVFPAGSVVQPGATCRVYTNRAGSFSFNTKRAVWNDSGDVGMLYDASGALVSEYGFGTKETRTLESIKATYGVERMTVAFDDAQIAKQKRKTDKLDFLTAVERAIRSLLDDPAEQNRPNAANQVRDNFDGVPPNASAEVIQRFIRHEMNKGELRLLSDDSIEKSELHLSTKDQWIFRLRPGMGDFHWVIVDRMGAKDAYQEIT